MLARVVTFQGGSADSIRAAMEEQNSDIGLFENEDDLRTSAEALDAMDPPEGMGSRSSVDVYEVGAEVRM
jgi:hypothetical protein